MIRNYVHENYLKNKLNEKKSKDSKIYYKELYENHYLVMRKQIESFKLNEYNRDEYFELCSAELTTYWKYLLSFMNKLGISSNSKIHTNFLEEFSIYFLSKIPKINEFDIFTKNVFSGFKLNYNGELKQLYKDVDFCIGKEISGIKMPNEEELTIKIPIIFVEVKSYTDATMLGEIVNTSRKIKNAVPNSKSILLSFLKAFKDDHIYEIAGDSYINEIILMTNKSRSKSNNDVKSQISFTKKGLKDYYITIEKYMNELNKADKVNNIGSLLTTIENYKEENEV